MHAKQVSIIISVLFKLLPFLPNVKGRQMDMLECKFNGETPSFYIEGYWISCSEKNSCICDDGLGTGYKGCHRCCCGIRQKQKACPNKTETATVDVKNDTVDVKKDYVKSYQIGFFVILAAFATYIIISAAYISKQKKKMQNIQEHKKNAKNGVPDELELTNVPPETMILT